MLLGLLLGIFIIAVGYIHNLDDNIGDLIYKFADDW